MINMLEVENVEYVGKRRSQRKWYRLLPIVNFILVFHCDYGLAEDIFSISKESGPPQGEMGYLFAGRGDGVDTCPVTGDKLRDKRVKGDFFGRTVYFCCSGCLKHARMQPTKFLKLSLDEQRKAMEAVRAKAETIDKAEFCD